ncbi:unnamed protein product, partial [Ilex paraguariensis]
MRGGLTGAKNVIELAQCNRKCQGRRGAKVSMGTNPIGRRRAQAPLVGSEVSTHQGALGKRGTDMSTGAGPIGRHGAQAPLVGEVRVARSGHPWEMRRR